METEHLGIRVDKDIKDKLIELAKKDDRTLSNFLVRIFRNLVEGKKID